MRAAGLLDRLQAEDEGLTYVSLASDQVDMDSYIESIKANIGKVLNARRGSGLSSQDYGLADFNDGATESDDMSKYIMSDIKRCICDFEPRVRDVSVRAVPLAHAPLSLVYQLSLEVESREGDDPLQFEVHLGQGQVQLV